MSNDLKAIKAIDKLADELEERGVYLPEGYKRRDQREPGRAEKELAEVKLTKLIKRLFAGQKKRIREWIEFTFPGRKQAKPPEPPEDVFEDEEIKALIIALFLAAVFAGIDLAATDADDLFDLLETKNLSIDFVRAYTTQWLLDLNETTRKALLKALQLFMETPGMTIGELMKLLPFEEQRLLRIATTEITRMYAVGVQLAGEQLARDFPGVRVIKTWFTNRDEIVCERCEPLNGVSVKIKDDFINGIGLPIFHPPDHVSGRCWISARLDINKSVELQKKS